MCRSQKYCIEHVKEKSKNAAAEQDEIDRRQLNMDRLDLEAFQEQYGFGLEVQELFEKLDNKDKDILCLKYGEGYSNKEIGEMIDLSEESVRKRVYRARIRMKSILIEREGK